MKSQSPSLPSASLLRRLAAMGYDALLLIALAMAYGGLSLYIKVAWLGETYIEGEKAQLSPIAGLGLIAVFVIFFCLFWRRGGQTLGMKTWRLQLLDQQGGQPSLQQCLIRCLFASLSLASFGLGYLWCLFDQQGNSLHDKLSRTRVVQLPKNK